MILAKLRAAMLAAIPGLDAPKAAFFRVVRNVAGRLNLQHIGASDQTVDMSNVEVCPGVPGVTSDAADGETPIVAFIGADGVPYVIARASESMPGHTPVGVYHDASRSIYLITKAASVDAKVFIGALPRSPVALAPPVNSMKAALAAFALTSSTATTAAQIAAAALTMSNALALIPTASATKLDAK